MRIPVQVVRNSNGNFAFTSCCHCSSSPWSYITATEKWTSFGHHLGIETKDAIFEVLPRLLPKVLVKKALNAKRSARFLPKKC